jgi:hypothetical protein
VNALDPTCPHEPVMLPGLVTHASLPSLPAQHAATSLVGTIWIVSSPRTTGMADRSKLLAKCAMGATT